MSVSALATSQLSIAQTAPSRTSKIVRHAAIGGVVGAALGAGLSFTALPRIGGLVAPKAAAIMGAAGILVGGLVGFLRTRGGSDDAKVAGTSVGQQVPPPPGTAGSGLPPALPPA
jgi:hypothetical protein